MIQRPIIAELEAIANDLIGVAVAGDTAHHDDERVRSRATPHIERLARFIGGEFRPEYNGWPNRETWNAHLWITNEEGSYTAAREIASRGLFRHLDNARADYPDWSLSERRALAISRTGDDLKEWWEEEYSPETGPISDAWSYAIACVDWRQIAEALTEE